MGTCGRGYSSIPVDCATSAASPVEATEHSATTGPPISSPRPTRLEGPSRSVPARLPPHVRDPRTDRQTLPPELRRATAENPQRLRSTDPAPTRPRGRLLRRLRRMLRPGQRRAGPRQRAALSTLGVRRDDDRTAGPHVARHGRSTWSRLRSTERWPTGCRERCGIRSRALGISSPSVRATMCSRSPPRSWAPSTEDVGTAASSHPASTVWLHGNFPRDSTRSVEYQFGLQLNGTIVRQHARALSTKGEGPCSILDV